ncbi:MAG: hypothetical protein COT84_00065 [Chlamydiae bacterium CG10_big_fil_rev_8_21_14_0_10_35_9]|nr:MAG: hypothetical protein COT84_00065 [Chlamydiae bacterium CG10_big_fil_rev_8_21_14_0_10_35_9]
MIRSPYIALFVCLFSLLNLPQKAVDNLRSFSVACVGPAWQLLAKTPHVSIKNESAEKFLKLENQSLKTQIAAVQEWLQFDQRIEEQVEQYLSLNEQENELYWRDFFQRRSEELAKLIKMQLEALPATIIFRDPAFWSSSVWINVGEGDNSKIGRKIIAKNSPVVCGSSLIGLVEYVGKSKSRVRLITDAGLVLSVRAVRGKGSDQEFMQVTNLFLDRIKARKDLFNKKEDFESFISILDSIQSNLSQAKRDLYLAKGQIMGSSSPLWRCKQTVLQGIGFNYDYADEEGPARDLRTGRYMNEKGTLPEVSILEKGDLLITSGMDGVFPPNLHVGVVSEVDDLDDGSYAYSLKAIPTAGDFNDLSEVFVLPPLCYELE